MVSGWALSWPRTASTACRFTSAQRLSQLASGSPVVARTRANLEAVKPEGYASCCEAIGAMDLREGLDRIGAPTIVISGSDDPATPPDHGRQIADAIPGARFELVEGARHLANLERPELVTRLILEHLDPDKEAAA